MKISLRQLQIFIAISQSGSTAAAADLVALSQSAASASLNELESLLGVQLFDRVGKKLLLNQNGQQLMPQAMEMIDLEKTIENQFSLNNQSSKVVLRIGASTTIGNYILPSLLNEYSQTKSILPKIDIANTADISTAVANFEIDFGLIEGPCHESELIVEKWFEDELIIVSSHHHPLAIKNLNVKINSHDLSQAGWLLREARSGTREAADQLLIKHIHHLQTAGEFSNSEAIKHSASENLGIACLSRSIVVDMLRTGKLIELKTTLPPLKRNLYIIQNRRKKMPHWSQEFLEHCRTSKQ